MTAEERIRQRLAKADEEVVLARGLDVVHRRQRRAGAGARPSLRRHHRAAPFPLSSDPAARIVCSALATVTRRWTTPDRARPGDRSRMAERLDTMMNPPIEELLDRCRLQVHARHPGAPSAPGRSTRYYGQLGETASARSSRRRSPPPARKPLSIAFEEIAADKIEGITVDLEPLPRPMPDDGRRRDRRRQRLIQPVRWHRSRAAASSSASAGASPPTRRSRSVDASSTRERTLSRC
ncbi:MAG: hypothetical protein V9E94_06365 [Microthrixaceae bacterium]